MKNLPVKKQNSKIALSKTKNLMGIANKILINNNNPIVADDSWIGELWEWADKNDIPDLGSMNSEIYEWNYTGGLPRYKGRLLSLTELNMPYLRYENQTLAGEIGNLVKLNSLCLHYGSLKELPKEIGNLKDLTYLDLHENSIKTLPKEIGNLINLSVLNLNYNMLTKLPKEIGDLTSLNKLELSCNKLSELPKEIGNLFNLTSLSIDLNKLTKLPDDIIRLTKLTYLNIKGHDHIHEHEKLILTSDQKVWISELLKKEDVTVVMDEGLLERGKCEDTEDEWVCRLWKWADENYVDDLEWSEDNDGYWSGLPRDKEKLLTFTHLYFGGRDLFGLPEEIGSLSSLTEINLYNGQLKKIPCEIGKLSNLSWLFLMENHLHTLPKEIGNLSNLSGLALDSNRLRNLPKEIIKLENLTYLDMQYNPRLKLTEDQKRWILSLLHKGARVEMDDGLLDKPSLNDPELNITESKEYSSNKIDDILTELLK